MTATTIRTMAEITAAGTGGPSADPPVADGFDVFFATDSFAWGQPNTRGELEAKRRLIDPARFHVAERGGAPAGVSGSYPFDLTLPGGGTVAVSGVTDVGVVPTQRRRGVLTALMAREHEAALERGETAAALTASEAVIYRRFGYGVATLKRQVTVETARSDFHAGWEPPPGRVQLLSRPTAAPVLADVYERLRRHRPGWLSRSDAFWSVVMGDDELYIGGGRSQLVLVHTDHDGRPDGYVVYKVNPGRDAVRRPSSEIDVFELVGVDDRTELALWRVLLDHDLIGRVTCWVPPDHLLPDALADRRSVQPSHEADHVWLRILDVPAFLAARTYATEDEFHLAVVDPSQPSNTGTYRLETSPLRSKCERIDVPATASAGTIDDTIDSTLDIADLASLVLGGGSARRMMRAGRLHPSDPGVADRLDAAFRTDPQPWCNTRF